MAADAGSGQVPGWTAAIAVSDRCVYAGVIEHSVYTHPAHRRRGIGAALLATLIGSAEQAGIWTIQSGVFPENTASLRLHEQAGFRVVGTRERIGRHHGRWRDTVLIERRSAVTGTGRGQPPAGPRPSSASSPRTRPAMSSRIGRTCSTVSPAGSGSSHTR